MRSIGRWFASVFQWIAELFSWFWGKKDVKKQPEDPRPVQLILTTPTPTSIEIESEPEPKQQHQPNTISSPLIEQMQTNYAALHSTAPDKKRVAIESVQADPVVYDTLSPTKPYDTFSPLSTPAFGIPPPAYGALSPERLVNIQPFSFQPKVYRDLPKPEPRDKIKSVQFSAFAPACVRPGSKFLLSVWAYLRRQTAEMMERAKEEGEVESGRVGRGFSIRNGAYVHVRLDCPEGFRLTDECHYKRFQWHEKLTRVPFEVQCLDPTETQSIFHITIVVGMQVAKMTAIVITGHQSAPAIEKLESDVSYLSTQDQPYETIAYNDLKLKNVIGQGHYGDAYLAEWKNTSIVVKTFRSDQVNVDEFQHEAAVSALFGYHPRIVPFVGACVDPSQPLALASEYMPGGSVEQRFKAGENNSFTMDQRIQMLHDAASGILNLHESDFVHRDIAARNCLLDEKTRVQICDFGLTRKVQQQHGFLGAAADGFGPLKWMAPESISPPHVFSKNSDAYMFGVLMYEICTGNEPFANIPTNQAVMRILEGERLPIPTNIPENIMRIMGQCFHEHPELRPSLKTIYETLGNETTIAQKTRAPSLVQLYSSC